MFQAIFHGKVRNNLFALELGTEWRSCYRQTEDFLTAAVFGRLAYLPSHQLWAIIRGAAVVAESSHELPHDVGHLVTREFWPRWNLDTPQQDITWKEPDVFLGFERLHLLVEAKLGDFLTQNAVQWAGELAAFRQREECDAAIPLWLLAIGGMGERPTRTAIVSKQQEVGRLLHTTFRDPDTPVRLAACSWRTLMMALIEETKHVDPQAKMGLHWIMADLKEILEFHGIRDSHWLQDLLKPEVVRLRPIAEGSLETLAWWAWPRRTAVLAEHESWITAPDLRRIRQESIMTLGEIIDGQSDR